MKRLLAAFLFLHATLAAAQVGKLLPIDEAAKDPEFFAFRAQLQAAVASEWTRIKLRDGRTGYISSRYVRGPVGYRAIFNKVDGRWRMAAFVAGD